MHFGERFSFFEELLRGVALALLPRTSLGRPLGLSGRPFRRRSRLLCLGRRFLLLHRRRAAGARAARLRRLLHAHRPWRLAADDDRGLHRSRRARSAASTDSTPHRGGFTDSPPTFAGFGVSLRTTGGFTDSLRTGGGFADSTRTLAGFGVIDERIDRGTTDFVGASDFVATGGGVSDFAPSPLGPSDFDRALIDLRGRALDADSWSAALGVVVGGVLVGEGRDSSLIRVSGRGSGIPPGTL